MDVAKSELSVCEKRLNKLGYELVDLGTDLDSPAHLYSVFERNSHRLISTTLLTLDEVERFTKSLDGSDAIHDAEREKPLLPPGVC